MRHNIISGTVANRRDHVPFRVTARKFTRRVLIIAGVVFVATLALGFTLQAVGYGSTPEKPLPACKYEDGSASPLPCRWDADAVGNHKGDDVINYPDGTFRTIKD